MVRRNDYATNEGVRRDIYFEREDLEFVVEGFELGEPDGEIYDEESGDYFYHGFKSFNEAAKKYIELIEKGWETVRLSIRPKKTWKADALFLFHSYKEPVKEYCWALVQLSIDEINKECAEKLKKIQEILRR